MTFASKLLFFVLCFALLLSCADDGILNPSENLREIPILSIKVSEEDFERLLLNKTNDLEVPAEVFYKNENYSAVIEASGAGSRYHPKWSYTVELQNEQTIEGKDEFNLSSQVFDPTLLHTTVASHLYRQLGFELFNSHHVFLKINNVDQGLYPMIEKVEEPFFEKRNLSVFQLFKLGFDSKFSFEGTNYPEFIFEKKIPDDKDFTHLHQFIYARDTSNSEQIYTTFGKHLNINQYIRYHALTTLMNSFDAFTNNFFLYKKSPDAPFEIIPWDFDKTFQPYDTPELVGENEIITKLFENDSSFNAYKNEVRNQLNTIFTPENVFPVIDSTAAMIETAYNMDPYLGKNGRYNFSVEIHDLKEYIKDRILYFDNNIDNLTKDYFH